MDGTGLVNAEILPVVVGDRHRHAELEARLLAAAADMPPVPSPAVSVLAVDRSYHHGRRRHGGHRHGPSPARCPSATICCCRRPESRRACAVFTPRTCRPNAAMPWAAIRAIQHRRVRQIEKERRSARRLAGRSGRTRRPTASMRGFACCRRKKRPTPPLDARASCISAPPMCRPASRCSTPRRLAPGIDGAGADRDRSSDRRAARRSD